MKPRHTDPAFATVFGLALLLSGAGRPGLPNDLTVLERDAGWRLLFDGETTRGWRAADQNAPFAGEWVVREGWLVHPAGAPPSEIQFVSPCGDFELEFEWRAAPGAAAALRYRVPLAAEGEAARGPECILSDPAMDEPRAGALRGFPDSAGAPTVAPGETHRGRIVARGQRLEHWIDGACVLALERGGAAWRAALAASPFDGEEDFAAPRPGTLALRAGPGEVAFRSIRLRDCAHLVGREVPLVEEGSLAGWTPLGDARWSVEGDEIRGRTGGGSQSFLATERVFGDFFLDLELRLEDRGNSGIQIRSHKTPDGRLRGYQVEIDPSERAWSGGIYDEDRRGWLQDLSGSEQARAAFRPEDWNRYHIECIGPSIRTWVNGVPAADLLDPLDLAGVIGLQVHAGANTDVRWRHTVLRDLGVRAWEPLGDVLRLEGWDVTAGVASPVGETFVLAPGPAGGARLVWSEDEADLALRLTLAPGSGPPRVHLRAPRRPVRTLPRRPGLLAAGAGGITVDLARSEEALRALAAGATRVWILALGDRVSVHLGALGGGEPLCARLADERGLTGPRQGALLLESASGEPLRLAGVEALGPPRPAGSPIAR